jgi:hypothetical protein
MSYQQILSELPQLSGTERAELLQQLWLLQEQQVLSGAEPTADERRVLDFALAQFEIDGETGKPWRSVLKRIAESPCR